VHHRHFSKSRIISIPLLCSNTPNSDSDDSAEDDDSSAEDDDIDEGLSSVPASQEDLNAENLEPGDMDGSVSPIDENMNWAAIEDELAEFMGGDDTDDGNDSDASTSTTGTSRSARGTKRNHGEMADDDGGEDDEDPDQSSASVKKQRVSNDRSTGLKTIETPDDENSLPTPGKTDPDEEDEEDEDEDDEDFGDLEADLEAELAADG